MTNSVFKRGDRVNLGKLTDVFKTLYMNLTAILFLVGIVLINVAIFMRFDVPIGLISTGISLMFVAWLVNHESEKYAERR